jgi:2-methylisocitrate lyase-like PEP mutase family enzyme
MTQIEKGKAFRAMHERESAFLIPNPWDAGTARLLAHLGFEALATTSAGYAFSAGQRDNTVGRDAAIAHVAAIASATDLPVSGDLENGFGDAPEIVAETIRLAAAAGLAGGSIEDASGRPDHPIYARAHAVERIRAAAEAVRALPFTFMLTAGRRTTSMAGLIFEIQSSGCKPIKKPALMCFMRQVLPARKISRP